MTRLQPDLDTAGLSAIRTGHLERGGANHGAVPTEEKAVAIFEPGDFILGGMEGPEA